MRDGWEEREFSWGGKMNKEKDDFFKERLSNRNNDQILQVYLIKSIDKLRKSTEDSSKNAHLLSKKIFWLNIVLAAATAIATFATVWMIFCE